MIIVPKLTTNGQTSLFSIEELVVFILLNQTAPVTTKELILLVSTYKGKVLTYKGMKFTLDKLVKKNIVKRLEKKDSKLKYKYVINLEELKESRDILNKIINEKEAKSKVMSNMLEFFLGKKKKLSSILELDTLLEGIEDYWIKNLRKDGKFIIYKEKFNKECLFPQSFGKSDKLSYYILCQSKGFADIKRGGKWKNKKAYIQLGSAVDQKCDIRVFGEYVAIITYGKSVITALDQLFGLSLLEPEVVFKQLQEVKGDIIVELRNNPEEAELFREEVFDSFADGELRDMILDLKEQKVSNTPLFISSKYVFVPREQVNKIYDIGKKTGILISESRIHILAPLLLKFLKKHFKKGENIALVDMGVGPAVNPISLLPNIATHFNTIEYLGVDYSENVIEAAENHISQYNFSCLKSKFLRLDLLKLESQPNKLLSHIVSQNRIFLFLGSTYGNFHHEDVKKFFSKIVKSGDLIVIDNTTYNSKEDYDKVKHRYPMKIDFEMRPLYEIGFEPDNFDVSCIFNDKTSSVEMIAKVKSLPIDLIPPIKEIGIKKGDEIKVFMARKPTPKQFEKEIKALNDNLEVEIHTEEMFSIAFCKVK